MKSNKRRERKLHNISRIDSKNTHGWYVRIYLNGGVFSSKLFSDRVYGGKQKALKSALVYRDHNQMVADLQRDPNRRSRRKPYFDKPSKNNSSGITGVNEVHTYIRSRPTHYIQATWSDNGKPRSKKFYVTSKLTRDEAFEKAVEYRKEKEEQLMRDYKQKMQEQDSKR